MDFKLRAESFYYLGTTNRIISNSYNEKGIMEMYSVQQDQYVPHFNENST